MVLATRATSMAASALRTAMRSSHVASTSQQAISRSSYENSRSTLVPSLRRCHWSNKVGSSGSSSSSSDKMQKRAFQSSSRAEHGGIKRPEPGTGIKVTFRDSKGVDIKTVEVNEGDDLLSIAHEYDIDLEGACEGSIACSTCHVILDSSIYDKLEEPGDDENDMLDLAFGLTDTSRLGCQVKVTRDLDGMVAQLPSATRNMYVDGAKGGHGH